MQESFFFSMCLLVEEGELWKMLLDVDFVFASSASEEYEKFSFSSELLSWWSGTII